MDGGSLRQPFGYKTAWIAARDVSPAVVADGLGLGDQAPTTWEVGVAAAYDAGVFVCPPVEGWVLAMGMDILLLPLDVAALSAALGTEVQMFKSHRVAEHHHWSRAQNGIMVRAFDFNFDHGELTTNSGRPTDIEATTPEIAPALGSPPGDFPFGAYESLNDAPATPNEDSVMIVADSWSLDPNQLDGEDDRLGIYGRRSVRAAAPPPSSGARRRWRFRK